MVRFEVTSGQLSGIAKELKKQGVGRSFVQAAAAAQAGASVIQPNIGRLGDWYTKHPGAIRNPKGPREDSGATSSENPGIRLAERIYAYVKQFHPKTRVMISGIRRKEGPSPHPLLCSFSVTFDPSSHVWFGRRDR